MLVEANTFHIRPATPADAAFLARCVCEGIGFEIFEQETEFNTQVAAGLEPLAAREDTLYSYRHALVAEVEGNVAGALISYPGEQYHALRRTTFRELPHFRELDLMRTRIAWAEQQCPDLKISLLVDPDNEKGQRIYTRLGFVVTDRNVIAFDHLYWKMVKISSSP